MAGRMNNTLNLAAAILAALILSTNSMLTTDAEAKAPVPQTLPIISSNIPMARDIYTFDADRNLEAACRKTGQDKAVCLCVTHILKYELTLSEHRIAARLFGQAGDRKALHQTLEDEGFTLADIERVAQVNRALTQDKDFALRCAEAKAYYKNSG